jgi:hypothetical protein
MARHPAAKSRAFFLELVLNLVIFVFCAAVCLQVFAAGYDSSRKSEALSHLSIEAQTIAEHFQAADGDIAAIAPTISATRIADTEYRVYYSPTYTPVSDTSAPYMISCEISSQDTLVSMRITAWRQPPATTPAAATAATSGEQLFVFDVTAVRGS